MNILKKFQALPILLALGLFPLWSWGLAEDAELLPEEEAFAFQAALLPDSRIEVRWEIADGYYMYRDKMSYDITGDGALSGTVELPPGKRKNDEFFGEVEVYMGSVSMVLPLKESSTAFTLVADGQGCNEPIGVCYPPMRHEVVFGPGGMQPNASAVPPNRDQLSLLPAKPLWAQLDSRQDADPAVELRKLLQPEAGSSDSAATSSRTVAGTPATNDTPESGGEAEDSIAALKSLLESGFPQPEFLPPEEAFQLTVEVVDGNTLHARFDVAEGYYLYRDKITFGGQGDARVGDYVLPDGEEKEDPFFGSSRVFKHPFTVPIDLQRTAADAGTMTLAAGYQGCAEQGICYPPSTQTISLSLPPMIVASVASERSVSLPGNGGFTGSLSSDSTDSSVRTGSLFSILAGALLAGLLLTFTPCVLPMIPILSGVIAGQGEKLTRARGGALACIYVLGTAVTYAAMGWLAGATGEQLQAYFQNVWAIGILAAVFVLMALSMFGLYEIQMPSAIQSRLQNRTSGFGGSYPMVFLLGLVSALIVGACVSPILISFLGIAVSRADPVLGAQMMVAMSLGMGVPLIALGFGAGYLLPKAGAWMETVKRFFGVLLVAVAIYLLGVLPEVPILLFWGAFFVIVSTYLGATQSLPDQSTGWHRFQKGIGILLLVWGIAALVGGFYGERNLLKPLPVGLFSMAQPTNATGTESGVFTTVDTISELDRQFVKAGQERKPVLLDYYADWCVDCVKMKQTTFKNPEVVRVLREHYLALQVDVTDPNDPDSRAIKKRFGVFGPPAVLFFDPEGHPLPDRSFYGYRAAEELLTLMNR